MMRPARINIRHPSTRSQDSDQVTLKYLANLEVSPMSTLHVVMESETRTFRQRDTMNRDSMSKLTSYGGGELHHSDIRRQFKSYSNSLGHNLSATSHYLLHYKNELYSLQQTKPDPKTTHRTSNDSRKLDVSALSMQSDKAQQSKNILLGSVRCR